MVCFVDPDVGSE